MRISEAKLCIKELYLNTESVTALISERGVGKTSAYRQCADELGIGYIGLYAAALEGPDFMGLPDKDREKGLTRYLAPQFLPTQQAVDEGLFPAKGLLVFEEINRVPSDTTSVLYPLLLERKINGHNLAPGWRIGVTMNPDTMNYSVNSLDDAMLDRFVAIEINADLNDYIDYSIANHPNDDVLAYLQACPDMLLVVRRSADASALTKSPTPRGWTKVQELMNNCSLDQRLMYELIAGILGPETASSFFSHLKDKSLRIPSVEKLLKSFEEVRPIIGDIIRDNRMDILTLLIKKTAKCFDASEDQRRNLDAFLGMLPEEPRMLFFKLLASYKPREFSEAVKNLKSYEGVMDRIIGIMTE